MTVIAYANGTMAADTMLSAGNRSSRVQKIVRLPDGGVAGGCGLWTNAWACLKWLAEGGDAYSGAALARTKDFLPDVTGASILIARPDGSLWVLEDDFPAIPLLDTVHSVGCGSDAAMMAMNLGLSPVEAVAKVAKLDLLCGDPVQSMDVYTAPEYPGVTTHVPEAKKARVRR